MLNAKLKVGLSLLVINIVLAGNCFVLNLSAQEEVGKPSIEVDLKSCSVNNDCIKIKANPCKTKSERKYIPCKAIAINKAYKDYWNNLLIECESKGVKCEDTVPSNESFRMDPECIEGVCKLTKQRPYIVFPPSGTTTTDRTIPLGWFSVDESKHIIQIDNNPDFSSPEVEEDETAYGIFRPKVSLSDGTYYWRVKSTNKNIWSDIYSITIITID